MKEVERSGSVTSEPASSSPRSKEEGGEGTSYLSAQSSGSSSYKGQIGVSVCLYTVKDGGKIRSWTLGTDTYIGATVGVITVPTVVVFGTEVWHGSVVEPDGGIHH